MSGSWVGFLYLGLQFGYYGKLSPKHYFLWHSFLYPYLNLAFSDITSIKGHARHAANQLGKAEGMTTLIRASKSKCNESFKILLSY